ncbi:MULTISPECIES: modification methylase [unclassified Gilliamella]|uniref:modification methylase n=1 Tax=unclassified Gilliamella TaxID=2685620 RepID=UPI0013206C78|nr:MULTISPECIES: modification methylase [unclassified Gilliamella]MWN32861.1 modification methylase [Gilliamella sp. Pra-s60]MWP30323.1 modification methylase [Gilliamella sp. Pra-s54]
MIGDISFRDYKKNDIHGLALYPATMVAPVQNIILQELLKTEQISSVFDPFHGSGTALYEALELSPDIKLIGCDINPLAHLITLVKLQGITKNITKDILELKGNLNTVEADDFSFPNMNKWFRPDITESIKKVRQSIILIKSKKNRLYFWSILSTFIRKYSNTRSSTYKLHSKDTEAIERMKNTLINDFLSSVEDNVSKFTISSSNIKLYKNDVLNQLTKFKEKTVDLSISSPPYGDNATTVPYGQFSSLALHWIDKKDLVFDGWELDNYSSIDRRSLGGNYKGLIDNEKGNLLIKPYLEKISTSKQKKVICFFKDYFIFLDELCRVTNKYIVLTLGNRTVDGININLTSITQEYLEYKNFKNIHKSNRDIPNKRIPRLTSKVNNKSVLSMNKEYVIIHRRIN